MDHDKLIAYQAAVQRAEGAKRNYLNTSADNPDALATAHEEYVEALAGLQDTNVGGDPEPAPEPSQRPPAGLFGR